MAPCLIHKHSTMLEKPISSIHSSFLCPFVSYEENKVMWLQPKVLPFWIYSQVLQMAVRLELAQEIYLSGAPLWGMAPCLIRKHYTKLEKPIRNRQSSLLGPFVSYEENKALRLQPKVLPFWIYSQVPPKTVCEYQPIFYLIIGTIWQNFTSCNLLSRLIS